MQAPRADVLGLLVHSEGERGHLTQRVRRELQLQAFGFQQRHSLLYQRTRAAP